MTVGNNKHKWSWTGSISVSSNGYTNFGSNSFSPTDGIYYVEYIGTWFSVYANNDENNVFDINSSVFDQTSQVDKYSNSTSKDYYGDSSTGWDTFQLQKDVGEYIYPHESMGWSYRLDNRGGGSPCEIDEYNGVISMRRVL
jgi:hypothetical protein